MPTTKQDINNNHVVRNLCVTYAFINLKPHYPPPGLTRGLVRDFDPEYLP